jgi:hypothetical protein
MAKEANTSRLTRDLGKKILCPFNLVDEMLGALLDKAKNEGRIKDLMTHLLQGITHIQYADDIE